MLLEFVIDIAISVFLNEKGQVYFCCVCISVKSINVSKEESSTVLFESYCSSFHHMIFIGHLITVKKTILNFLYTCLAILSQFCDSS